jgi:hypothetical protein
MRSKSARKKNPLTPPAGWYVKTATRDGYRVYERATEVRNGAVLRVEGFDPELCAKQGLPAVWNWSAQTGGRSDKHGTAFALKRAVALAEAAGETLNATRPRVNPKNPEGDSGAIPYKTWMKLTDALTAAHAAGQAWIHAGRPRPSPLYDAYNVADRELLRQEEAARWPYRGNAEQRKEWSRIHAHFDARKNPAPALYDAWVVVREKGTVLDPMGYASTLGPFFNKKQALAAKKKHGGRLVGIRPGHQWFGRNHPNTVRWFKGTKGQKEEVPWSIVEDMQHRTVRRFSTARQAESWADYHGYPYDGQKGENVRTLRVRGSKAPIPNPKNVEARVSAKKTKSLVLAPVAREMYRTHKPGDEHSGPRKGGSYTSWIESSEQPLAREAYARVEAFVAGLSKAEMVRILNDLGVRAWPAEKATSLRSTLHGALLDQMVVPTRVNPWSR